MTGDTANMQVPVTIQSLIAARLDGLTPAERRWAERAAVVGREFTDRDVGQLANGEADPRAILQQLVAKDVIVPTEPSRSGVQSYRFRHIMIRDVVYQAASKAARADDHERLATVLEADAQDRPSEYDDVAGHHLESALNGESNHESHRRAPRNVIHATYVAHVITSHLRFRDYRR